MSDNNGPALRLERRIRRLTQLQLSAMLGVSRRTYIRYEKTGAPPPVALLAKHIFRMNPATR